jgi:hypothetical protein
MRSKSNGRFLLLTIKDRFEAAEASIDKFFFYMDSKGFNETMARDGE